MTSISNNNRFQDFFEEDRYVSYKNYLYNYRLRKRAIEKSLQDETCDLVLELGSGISPVMTRTDRIVYSDLSFSAIRYLKRSRRKGHHLVADAVQLPFKADAFSHAVCSEVLEHLENDAAALGEISRVLKSSGVLMLTFPHRKAFFSNDDRYVNHYRRYEVREMEAKLKAAGFKIVWCEKVLGPLEKITMATLIYLLSKFKPSPGVRKASHQSRRKTLAAFIFEWLNALYMGVIWLDARLMPNALSAVKLIKAQKQRSL